MADDDRRVEAKETLVGRGCGTTPERIAEIERRAAEVEKLGRPEPVKSFAEVMGEKGAEAEGEEELSEKETRLRALPKKGPRPALVHPSQREVCGREDEEEDPVILKG
jgi:hypothetical protein